MALGEFDLIAKYFTRPARRSPLGVGDDCALLAPAPGMQLAVSCDMLVEGRHFLPTVDPARLGHKALAVNLSDLAACGARPLAFMLALSMPRVDEVFLAGLARGMFALADEHDIDLVGGDTTAGPLTLCVTVFGEVPPGLALLRSGARPGDDIWVSHAAGGGLGDARLALEMFRGRLPVSPGFERLRRAMECPQPRVGLGVALRGVASSAIDVSDGLVGDLGHILERSGVGASVDLDALPRSELLAAMPLAVQRECTAAGGDDYELLFTAPSDRRAAVRAAAAASGVDVTPIGFIEAVPGLRLIDAMRHPIEPGFAGFDHFAGT
jgi:thiamine-monophosphate kinase